MIMIEDTPGASHGGAVLPDRIDAERLLLACAQESLRQAAAMARLDAALGALMLKAREQANHAVFAPLGRELQETDRLRQEMEGLARTIALLAGKDRSGSAIGADEIRTCTPNAALQSRLMTGGA